MEPFRTREVEKSEPVSIPKVETSNLVKGVDDKAISAEFKPTEASELDNWEIQHGKYGAEYLGIKEIVKEFPMKAQFGELDKYIKDELSERGYDKTPEAWQNILKELETEIGSDKLNAIERLKKLSGYIKTLKRLKEATNLKNKYLNSTQLSV